MQGSKKRKQEADVDAERTLYSSFVHAANAVSQLYTQAQQQHNRSKEEGARLALEHALSWVFKEYGTSPAVPTGVLVEFLRHELQSVQGSAAQVPVAFPVHICPPPQLQDCLSDTEDENMGDHHAFKQQQQRGGGAFSSPGKRLHSAHTLPNFYQEAAPQEPNQQAQQQPPLALQQQGGFTLAPDYTGQQHHHQHHQQQR